ncbi:MAG TPA: 6-phosphogluconolactonase [Solirubrobacteraceae bacterium]|nr:6-phosphogluconolactonase [Solirubrobacteraceae bacterium]
MSVSIEILADPARSCATLMVGAALRGGQIVLTGGSTPRSAYSHFAQAVRTVDMDLSGTTFWVSDERCVPVDDERCNWRMISESLLDALGPEHRPAAAHRMRGELGPGPGAEDYERELLAAGPPCFDLVLLGIGPDGHCASLFANQPSLSERERLVVGVPQAGHEPLVPRISLTLPAIARAREVVFLATGESKAPAVARAFGAHARPDPATPASLVAAQAASVTVLLDEAAASALDGSGSAIGGSASALDGSGSAIGGSESAPSGTGPALGEAGRPGPNAPGGRG